MACIDYAYSVSMGSGVSFMWTATATEFSGALVVDNPNAGWIGWAVNDKKEMIGGDAIIGVVATDSVSQYLMTAESVSGVQLETNQALTDTSITVTSMNVTMTFTRPIAATDVDGYDLDSSGLYFMYAWGNYGTNLQEHKKKGYADLTLGLDSPELFLNATACETDTLSTEGEGELKLDRTWAHGICMAISFGFLMPLAIMAPRYGRGIKAGQKEGMPVWLIFHLSCQLTAFLLAMIGFGLIVSWISDDDNDHFSNDHERWGIAILAILTAQILGGLTRPHVPEAGAKKSLLRLMWEIGHRIFALGLLGVGFYQCFNGIKIVEGVSNRDQWNALFAALLALMGFLFVVLEVHSWCVKSDEKAPMGKSVRENPGLQGQGSFTNVAASTTV